MKITITTHIPSPYQVELFDAIAEAGKVDLRVVYSERHSSGRSWATPKLAHHSAFLEDDIDHARAIRWVKEADLLVCGWYGGNSMRGLLGNRVHAKMPYVLWGERPQERWPFLSRLRRRFHLRHLFSSTAPIWGIGSWAIEGWKREFGGNREYFNVPYYSNLERFAGREKVFDDTRTILFSGSLIERKGIDLLTSSFAKLAPAHRHLRLVILGAGPLETRLRFTVRKVADQVEFRGFVDWDSLPNAYQSGGMLFAPSRYDGWGLIVPEGLAAGMPVLATKKMGAALDLIEENFNGWLIDADNPAAVTDAVGRFATLPASVLKQFSTAASDSVKGHSLGNGVNRFLAAAAQSCR